MGPGASLESRRQAQGWPLRSAKVVLQLALQSLARHYGLASGPAAGHGRPQIRHWGADGYRPALGTPDQAG